MYDRRVEIKFKFFFYHNSRREIIFGAKMGKSKRVQSPHRKNSNAKNYQNKSIQRRRSLLTLVSPEDINEGTLQIWRSLPSKIRQDPTFAPFRLENERVHGRHLK